MTSGRIRPGYDAIIPAAFAGIASAIRVSAGMLILAGVFLVAHGLLLVHDLGAAEPSPPGQR
jgi:hypothetical protein